MLSLGQIRVVCMVPRHGSSGGTVWLILIVHAIEVLLTKQFMWIIHPISFCAEVMLRTAGFSVGLTGCSMQYGESGNHTAAIVSSHPNAGSKTLLTQRKTSEIGCNDTA